MANEAYALIEANVLIEAYASRLRVTRGRGDRSHRGKDPLGPKRLGSRKPSVIVWEDYGPRPASLLV